MNTIKLAQTNIGILTDWLREYIAQFTVTPATGYEAQSRPLSVQQAQVYDAEREEQLFRQAVQENSNMEFDWLWCAANMTSIAQKRYCLLRALDINPDSKLARRALAKLPPKSSAEAVAPVKLTSA